MAVAFVAVVCLSTILIVTKRREEQDYSREAEEEEEELAPVSARRRVRERTADSGDAFRDFLDASQRSDRGDYGYSELNPVCVSSTAAAEKYLASLRTERGEGIRWLREGTVTVKKLGQLSNVNEELSALYLHGNLYHKLYICPLGRKAAGAPKGLMLAADDRRLSYNGSIALEAKEKGISEEQVIEKHAFVYENRRSAYSDRNFDSAAYESRHFSVSEKQQSSEQAPAGKPQHIKHEPVAWQQGEEQTEKEEEKPAAVFSEKREERPAAKLSEKQEASFPKYLPGFEPDSVKPALEKFLAVMDRAYPDGIVYGDTWDHAKWDRAAAMLCKYLGYDNGSEFLEAYGYTVEKS